MTSAKTLSPTQTIDWLRLARTSGVGPVTFQRLIARFGDATSAIARLPELARNARGKVPQICPREDAEAELETLDNHGGELLLSCDGDYPPLLNALDAPPPVLSVLGDPGLLLGRTIALVGSRNASALGMRFAGDLARDLGQAGLMVASGMARGIDGAAHAGSMETGTIAVLAGGVDHVYPPEHLQLREDIIAHGALVSERRWGLRVSARDFPRRNRIIAGLSQGVIVVEAAKRSGSLITARDALDQGREVFAAPGSPLDPRCSGSNGLIRDGAHLVETVADVITVLDGLGSGRLLEDRAGYASPPPPVPDASELDKVRDRIRQLLSPSPVHMDELVRAANLPPHIVMAVLVELELADLAICLPGGKVCAGSSWSV